jgi:sulfate/thiosulfate transport system ATP-binding protein
VADRIVVMNKGKIEQVGTPQEVYEHPTSPYVFNFLGHVNQFRTYVKARNAHIHGVDLPITNKENYEGPALAFIRPHEFEINLQKTKAGSFQAKVNHIYPIGSTVRVELNGHDHEVIEAELTSEAFRSLKLHNGQNVYVSPKNITIYHEEE